MKKSTQYFICKQCNHKLPMKFQMKTKGYCYMCDPHITVEELLSAKSINNPCTNIGNLESTWGGGTKCKCGKLLQS